MAIFSKPATRHSLAIVLITFLFLRSRIARVSRHALTRLAERARGGKALTPSEITKATQQVYLNDSDGGKTLLVLYRDRLFKVSTYILHIRRSVQPPSSDVIGKNPANTPRGLRLGCTTLPSHSFRCQGKTKHRRRFSETIPRHSVPHCIPTFTFKGNANRPYALVLPRSADGAEHRCSKT